MELYEDGFVTKADRAKVLKSKGISITEIARRLEVEPQEVQEYLQKDNGNDLETLNE